MTLTRRIALFITTLLLLALGGALVIHTLAARQAVQQQQDLRNRDAAAALALALSQQRGDLAAMQAVAAAQFDLGHYRSITLQAPDGHLVIQLQQAAAPSTAPGWFVRLLPVDSAPGTALVSDGWRELGRLTVAAHSAWADAALWNASARTAALLAALASAAALLTAWMLRAWQRPLQATVDQAQALEQGRFVEAPLPDLPELRLLTRSMNATVRRLRDMFAAQAGQVAYLQRQAQLDPLTGLPLRQHLLALLNQRLGQPDSLGLGLLLVRVAQLDQLNQQAGHDRADALLRQVGQLLDQQLAIQPDSFAGRFSGSDFVLCLPVPGMASDQAPALYRQLGEVAAGHGARLVVAALDGLGGQPAEAALQQGQAALARAEAGGGLLVDPQGQATSALAGWSAWQAQMAAALAEGRMRLGEFAVVDPHGTLVHLECPLRLQLDPDGHYLPAARWLALARRGGLLPKVDLAAIRLALAASANDRRPRAVNVELASLASPGFLHAVGAQLTASGGSAQLLSIEWVASGPAAAGLPGSGGQAGNPAGTQAATLWQAAIKAIATWRAQGVRMGVEHAGAAPDRLAGLRDLGLDYVKVDARHLRGVAADASVKAYAHSLVGLIQLLGLKAYAEGVDSTEDLAVLWQLGFDGATGRALDLGTMGNPTVEQPVPLVDQPAQGHPA